MSDVNVSMTVSQNGFPCSLALAPPVNGLMNVKISKRLT